MNCLVNHSLKSNGFALSCDPDRLAFLTASDPAMDRSELYKSFWGHGYIWIKRLLDPEIIHVFRRRFLQQCDQHRLLKAGSNSEDGIFSGVSCSQKLINQIRQDCLMSPEFHSIVYSPKILDITAALLADDTQATRRKLIRCKFPNHSNEDTGAHYDRTYFRGGGDQFVTAWVPLGNISTDMGGLVYLENSHMTGQEIENRFDQYLNALPEQEQLTIRDRGMGGKGWLSKDLGTLAEVNDTRWLIANYEAGDVVIHSPYMIHASSSNINPQNRIRLSADIRYHSLNAPIDRRWDHPWSESDGL
jgi:ectoine hydroxylase-related dioxygenase (phytanoyl-CoA dioxygenase family)